MARTALAIAKSDQEVVLALPTDIYNEWQVKIRIREGILGTLPANENQLEAFAESCGMSKAQKAELREEVDATEEEAQLSLNVFKRDDEHGFYIEDRQIKACLKECAERLGYLTSGDPGRQYFQHAFFVEPRRIYLGAMKETDIVRATGVVTTAKGPMNIMTAAYMVKPERDLVFRVKALPTQKREKVVRKAAKKGTKEKAVQEIVRKDVVGLKEEQLVRMVTLSQEDGLGARRAHGYGTFDVVELRRIRYDEAK